MQSRRGSGDKTGGDPRGSRHVPTGWQSFTSFGRTTVGTWNRFRFGHLEMRSSNADLKRDESRDRGGFVE